MPRFNLSWLYVIIAMSFAILYFSNQEGGIDKQITYTEFKDMINKGYANKIIAYDDNTVEMYIKPEFVKDVFKNDYKKVGRNPALNVEIGSMESLDKFMEKAQEEGHFTGSISYEKKRDYFGALFWNIFTIDRYLDVCHAPHERRSRGRRRQSVQRRQKQSSGIRKRRQN